MQENAYLCKIKKNSMKTKVFFICLILGLTLTTVQAQDIRFGVKAGLNISNLSASDQSITVDYASKPGFQLGLTVDYRLWDDLYVLSGLELTQKGSSAELSLSNLFSSALGTLIKSKMTVNAYYLQLPLRIGYKLDLGFGSFVPQAGPYFAYGLGGKTTTDTDVLSDLWNFSVNDDTFDNFKRFDCGLAVGVGLEVGKLGIAVGYDLGLVDINKDFYGAKSVKNKNLNITLGYKF